MSNAYPRHLAGWLWPILIVACAAKDQETRETFLRLFPMAKSPIGDKDNSDVAKQVRTGVYEVGQADNIAAVLGVAAS